MSCCGCEIVSADEKERKIVIYIPMDSDNVMKVKAGADVTVTIKGKVKGGRFSAEKSEWEDASGNLEIEVDDITVKGSNYYAELADS